MTELNIAAGGVRSIEVDKQLIQYCRCARSRYQEYMEAKRAENAAKDTEASRKREAAKAIKELEIKKAKLLADAEKEIAALDVKLSELKK